MHATTQAKSMLAWRTASQQLRRCSPSRCGQSPMSSLTHAAAQLPQHATARLDDARDWAIRRAVLPFRCLDAKGSMPCCGARHGRGAVDLNRAGLGVPQRCTSDLVSDNCSNCGPKSPRQSPEGMAVPAMTMPAAYSTATACVSILARWACLGAILVKSLRGNATPTPGAPSSACLL